MDRYREEEIALDDAELSLLLDRIHRAEFAEPMRELPQNVYTVEDIAEALNITPDSAREAILELRAEHHHARVAGVIRELEEPLYRVERPGHAPRDSGADPIFRLRSVQILAERARQAESKLPERSNRDTTKEDRSSKVLGWVIMAIFAFILVLVAYQAAASTLR